MKLRLFAVAAVAIFTAAPGVVSAATLRLRGVANFDSEDLAFESADTYPEVEDYVLDFYDEDSSGDLDFIPKRQTIGKNKDKMDGLRKCQEAASSARNSFPSRFVKRCKQVYGIDVSPNVPELAKPRRKTGYKGNRPRYEDEGDLDFIPKRQTIGKNKDKMDGLRKCQEAASSARNSFPSRFVKRCKQVYGIDVSPNVPELAKPRRKTGYKGNRPRYEDEE